MTNDKFQPAVSFTPAETEQFRLERLNDAAQEQEITVEKLIQDSAPGTFTCHEALQMGSVFMDSIDRHLCEHPAVLADPDWYRLASEAQTALYNLYQAIGERHLTPGLLEKNEGRD